MIGEQLAGEFNNVGISLDPEKAAQDLEQQPPAVLLLAFDTLDKTQCHHLGLRRRASCTQAQAHRSVVLCDQRNVQRA